MFESLIQKKKAETVDTVSAFLCLFDTIDILRTEIIHPFLRTKKESLDRYFRFLN